LCAMMQFPSEIRNSICDRVWSPKLAKSRAKARLYENHFYDSSLLYRRRI